MAARCGSTRSPRNRALAFGDTFAVTAVMLLAALVLVAFMQRAVAPAQPGGGQ